jgi:hypothetical protein
MRADIYVFFKSGGYYSRVQFAGGEEINPEEMKYEVFHVSAEVPSFDTHRKAFRKLEKRAKKVAKILGFDIDFDRMKCARDPHARAAA